MTIFLFMSLTKHGVVSLSLIKRDMVILAYLSSTRDQTVGNHRHRFKEKVGSDTLTRQVRESGVQVVV